jgi:hypothetical protein
MKFTLEINCDNAAFEGSGRNFEVVRILHKLGKDFARSDSDAMESGNLRDVNGNTVGRFGFTED